MMTRKDYERAASIVRDSGEGLDDLAGPPTHRIAVQEAFASFFKSDNPRFDVERFRAARKRAPERAKVLSASRARR